MLQAMLEAHRQLPDDPKVHARENTRFHELIYRTAHNRFLLKSLQDLHDSVVLLGRTTFAAPGRIAEALGEPAGNILFLSDIVEELDAAREAGMRTWLLDRREDYPQARSGTVTSGHPRVESFAQVAPDA
jgi:methionine salvage enolase-phosphatase E1